MRSRLFTTVLVALTLALLSACDSGSGNHPGTTPELLQDTFRIVDNPAESGDVVTFVVAFEDLDGDMDEAELRLDFEDPDGIVTPVDLDDRFDRNLNEIEVRGSTRGTIRFRLVADPAYDEGEFMLAVTDNAGHTSNTVTVFLDVNDSR